MQATYQEGQDVAQYDMSYRVAYEMGKAGTKLSAAQTSEATDYLTDAQTQAGWSAGRDARTRLSDVSEVANGRALLNGQIAEVQTISARDGKLMAEVRQGESVQTVALDSLKVDAGTRTLAEGAEAVRQRRRDCIRAVQGRAGRGGLPPGGGHGGGGGHGIPFRFVGNGAPEPPGRTARKGP